MVDVWYHDCCLMDVFQDVTKQVKAKDTIRGIGFDATCSMVILDKGFQPLSVTPEDGMTLYVMYVILEFKILYRICFMRPACQCLKMKRNSGQL